MGPQPAQMPCNIADRTAALHGYLQLVRHFLRDVSSLQYLLHLAVWHDQITAQVSHTQDMHSCHPLLLHELSMSDQ